MEFRCCLEGRHGLASLRIAWGNRGLPDWRLATLRAPPAPPHFLPSPSGIQRAALIGRLTPELGGSVCWSRNSGSDPCRAMRKVEELELCFSGFVHSNRRSSDQHWLPASCQAAPPPPLIFPNPLGNHRHSLSGLVARSLAHSLYYPSAYFPFQRFVVSIFRPHHPVIPSIHSRGSCISAG